MRVDHVGVDFVAPNRLLVT